MRSQLTKHASPVLARKSKECYDNSCVHASLKFDVLSRCFVFLTCQSGSIYSKIVRRRRPRAQPCFSKLVSPVPSTFSFVLEYKRNKIIVVQGIFGTRSGSPQGSRLEIRPNEPIGGVWMSTVFTCPVQLSSPSFTLHTDHHQNFVSALSNHYSYIFWSRSWTPKGELKCWCCHA